MLIRRVSDFYFWEEKEVGSFNELILSWNALRPSSGSYRFFISIYLEEWTPWLFYAEWGSQGQWSSSDVALDGQICLDQDILTSVSRATGFRIRVCVEGGAVFTDISALFVYLNSDTACEQEFDSESHGILLPLQGISQMQLLHERRSHLCSPTSTTAVIHYLLQKRELIPELFAQKVWDRGSDIFGHWVFNVAAAFESLGPSWRCWVERLQGFSDVYQRLVQGLPTIVSVKGPLQGGALPYLGGHLMVVIGFHAQKKQIICMDPAFALQEGTIVSYDFMSFMQAWRMRGFLSYIFCPS